MAALEHNNKRRGEFLSCLAYLLLSRIRVSSVGVGRPRRLALAFLVATLVLLVLEVWGIRSSISSLFR